MAIRTRSLVLLFVALTTGAIAAWLAFGYLRDQARPLLNVPVSSSRAVVAARDLPVGAVVTQNDVRVVEWPGDAIPAGLIGAPEQVIGRGIIMPMRVNQPFLEANMAPLDPNFRGGLPLIIEPGMRAISFAVDNVVGVSGFVVAGTRVDVMLTMTSNTPTNEPTTKVILQNLETLAHGTTIQIDPSGQPVQVPVITLAVTPEQAETLAIAGSQGRLQLALRSALDTTFIRTTGARAGALMRDARAVTVVRRPGFQRAGTPQPTTETTIIEGFRGGSRTLDRFSRTRQPGADTSESRPIIPPPEEQP